MQRKIFIIFVSVLWLLSTASNMFLGVCADETGTARGGITIFKTDVFGNALSGAGFQVAREATHKELTDSSVTKRLLKVDGEMLTVVYDSFWDSREMSGKKQTEVVTASDGIAAVYGLPYGTYYLVESRSPEGYNPMPEPLRISINKYSHLTEEDNIRDDEDVVIDNTVHIITIRYAFQDSENRSSSYLVAAAAMLSFLLSILIIANVRRYCIS